MKHQTVQNLVIKAVALEKRVEQIEVAEILLAITGDDSLTDLEVWRAVKTVAESLKKGEMPKC